MFGRLRRFWFVFAVVGAASLGSLAGGTPAWSQGTVVALHLGDLNDVPITGDWNGSGRTQIGAYRPSNQTFYLGDVNGVSPQAFHLGDPGDVPITGDWNGSGRTQIGAYRPSNQTFYLGDVNGVSPQAIHFGDPGDVPITGDWNGSGRTQIGVYRPSNQTFYLLEVPPPVRPPPVAAPGPTPLPSPTPVPVSTPVQSVPVVVAVPKPHGRRHVKVRIRLSWTWNHRHTRLHWIRFGHMPKRATISVRCVGRGCSGPLAMSARAGTVNGLVRVLDGQRYRAGDRVFITISVRGRAPERVEVLIRNGAIPRARLI